MKWPIFAIILIAGCAQSPQIAEVQTYQAIWSYDAPDGFYTDTAFPHCAEIEVSGDAGLYWGDELPKEIVIHQMSRQSDSIDGMGSAPYVRGLEVRSPVDGVRYQFESWNLPYTESNSRAMLDQDGVMRTVKETVMVQDLGILQISLEGNLAGCE